MYLKILFNFILIVILAIFQISLISSLPYYLNQINLALVVLIFILVLGDQKLALAWSIVLGFLFDVYFFLPFGFFLVCLPLTILAADFLLNNFFTNRSFYAFMALTFFSTFLYEFLRNTFVYIIDFFRINSTIFLFTKFFWVNFFIKITVNLALTFVFFYIVSFVSLKLKPVFLVKNKKLN